MGDSGFGACRISGRKCSGSRQNPALSSSELFRGLQGVIWGSGIGGLEDRSPFGGLLSGDVKQGVYMGYLRHPVLFFPYYKRL